MPKWIKTTLKVLGGILALILLLFIAATLYITFNKQKVLTLITQTVNKSIDGKLVIGELDPTFFSAFPNVAVSLKNVSLKDNQWPKHKHTLLQAGDVEVAVNALSLIAGNVNIQKISINNASIDFFTDSTGYSNTAVFKKGKPKPDADKNKDSDEGAAAIIKRIDLNKVAFSLNNQKANKLFSFYVNSLKGKVDYPSSGWKAKINLDTKVKSLAFNTKRGSFLKDKQLRGPFDIQYTEKDGVITVAPNKLNIGEDPFIIGAKFETAKDPVKFTINIKVDELLWQHAANVLAPNIATKLNMFSISKPLEVTTSLVGDFGGGGDPAINVRCKVSNTTLKTPGGVMENCSFNGMFTNGYEKGKELGDENSAIGLYNFTGNYKGMPFTMDTTTIVNLIKPIASGAFRSKFDVAKLNNVFEGDPLKFNKGVADLNLHYKADIVDYQLNKPVFRGAINIKNADMTYVPRGLNLKNSSLSLYFTDNDLLFKNIQLQSGRSIVKMDGRVKNFLNLYYKDPEKMVLTWYVRSPQLYLGEFLGFLNKKSYVRKMPKKRTNNGNLAEQLNDVFEKASAELHMLVEKVYYKKFLATDAIASAELTDNGVTINSISLKHAGGSLNISGRVQQDGPANSFDIKTKVNHVNISTFFYAFDNFGLSSLTSKNLTGFLSSNASVKGRITNDGSLVPRSVFGTLSFDLKNGALKSFDPIKSVGKFAFPFRDLDNITFPQLNGTFDLRGEKINIRPMQISSSVLNVDMAGVYSLGTGTNIAIDVPLRNPKDDYKITDPEERRKKRMKGIVLHLLAADGDDGKVKIKLNRNRKKDKDKDDEKDKKKEEEAK
ncbi:AsmA family protein [Mucilaginibacter sp. UR6-1]|uniref:AsmA family protein n=1 Tax=Mucilaginibacter sp. UR6-1 TaxID=1435643 RepID=UPI001E655680|nr:AsmA-like C-terminal region-containing protein [Mucilaginibacter sp. UR6-1]MCC8409388.1 AsmA family protein [Mucilaginibacter sp. UR6-1]